MFIDTTNPFSARASEPAAAPCDRTFTVEPTETYWHSRNFYARLRKYGHGGGCIARGVPCYFGSIEAAMEAGRRWAELGK